MELLRLLLGHPGVELVAVTSRQEAGKPLAAVFPRFRKAAGCGTHIHRTGSGRNRRNRRTSRVSRAASRGGGGNCPRLAGSRAAR